MMSDRGTDERLVKTEDLPVGERRTVVEIIDRDMQVARGAIDLALDINDAAMFSSGAVQIDYLRLTRQILLDVPFPKLREAVEAMGMAWPGVCDEEFREFEDAVCEDALGEDDWQMG